MPHWQSKEDLVKLLSTLVGQASVTGSEIEKILPGKIYGELNRLIYFQEHQPFLQLHSMDDGRQFLTALVKKHDAAETIVLVSHFDVVDVEDYGPYKEDAFNPLKLTGRFEEQIDILPKDVQKDIRTGEWLFGRGVMDMKAGVSLHMAMIEQAALGEFSGNILMLTVPDEEVNSAGMIQAVPALLDLAELHGLQYKACLNSEPMFSNFPGDTNNYIYTGSLGKVLPGFLCYGKETHVGEPFSGLNANYMVSELNRELELNVDFCEMLGNEVTPPPTNLIQRDLKEGYSVQIPHIAVSYFNLLMMKRSLKEITDSLVRIAKCSSLRIEEHYMTQATKFASLQDFQPQQVKINVVTYEELYEAASERIGKKELELRQSNLIQRNQGIDDRNLSTLIVTELASLCTHLSPMIVIFYSPPYYPAVYSSENEMIHTTLQQLLEFGKTKYGLDFIQQHYFPGLSDLSYTTLQDSEASLASLTGNMPLYDRGYSLPLEQLRLLNMPVINVGPIGRDAHKWTERLHINYAFEILPDFLHFTIENLLKN
ncbi:M20/M25/M40 family metallo-hydrolase [Bacillus sp. PS06]|uniref:M20/M25/M40 family metallo-hydrolase n=1 Tax=Bacillus sp. PS06 TaxID=2764176 RepID=UPI00178614AD|nr:M20/M25/M40 family metallo-hydrolase [Bacillus sp. PS06]MBD8070361.1 M20/M25/M40 family metallo-hydrolase [Bacillus sp. PS06]